MVLLFLTQTTTNVSLEYNVGQGEGPDVRIEEVSDELEQLGSEVGGQTGHPPETKTVNTHQ